ncbi:hypothetical protein AFEL58S_02009 [Afipia felis]
MAGDQFLHGIETIENDFGGRPVKTVKSSVIGLCCTAPDADPANWPLNKPILITGERGVPKGLDSAGGEMKDSLDAIFDQASATVLAVRVEEGVTMAETVGNIIGDRTARTGLHTLTRAGVETGLKPKMLITPGYDSWRPSDGAADAVVSAGGHDYATAPAVSATAGEGGAVPVGFAAHAVVVAGAVTEVIIDNPGVGGHAPVSLTFTGGGGAGAAGTVTIGTTANPVVAEMLGIAGRLRAMIAKNGPNTTKEAAVADRLDWGSDRIMCIDPYVKAYKGASVVTQPSSARVVGLQAGLDNTKGFWWSPSNHVLNGVIGISRPIDWALNDPETEANYLNEHHVTTVIRDYDNGGFKLWGNRVTSGDGLKYFWSVRRTHDMIIESIEIASMIFVDRPFSRQLLLDIADTGNAYLRTLQRRGAILGGVMWLDPTLNTADQLAQGKLYISYDAEGPAPLEHLIFEFNRNTGYYREITEAAAREIARLAAA